MVDVRINPEDFPADEPPPAQPYKEGEAPFALGALVVEAIGHLKRIADAQETMAQLMQIDIEATIDAEVADKLNTAVNEKIAKTTERSFIGKPSG